MAIQFARTEIIKAEAGSSAVGLSAYITREDRRAEATDTAYGFEHRDDDLVFTNVYLPEDAPQWMRHGRLLWNAAEEAEITKDRKTREIRFKKNAQLAKHTVLALPKELDADEQQELLEKFISKNYTCHGVAVEAAIHAPHEDGDNWHAHILETTRVIKKNGLGKKARHLNPMFFKGTAYGDAIGARWGEHQNAYFKEKGMDLRVDPTTAIPSVQLRNGRFIKDNEMQKVNEQRRNKNIQLILNNPEIVADHLTQKKPFFTEREVSRYLFKAGFEGKEFDAAKAGVMAHGIALYERKNEKHTGKFTTKIVREQETLIMHRASNLVSRNNHKVDRVSVFTAAVFCKMSDEQKEAYLAAVNNGRDLSLWRGVAGSGKSYAMGVAKTAYEKSGYNVIGLAPTNTVARDMAKDGFKEARTLHSFLYKLNKGHEVIDHNSVIFVDEAGMVDNDRMQGLLEHAVKADAKVVLIGDDRQLASIERGGLFGEMVAKYGASELRQVRRQNEDWAKQASLDFAEGRFEKAIKPYEEHHHIKWANNTAGAKTLLVEQWTRDTENETDKTRFVYAQTNKDVNELNDRIRQVRQRRGELGRAHTFKTKRGEIELSRNDRIQFYETDKPKGIYNGNAGTVERVDGSKISARLDAGRVVEFDAREFQGFGHGYAGTVYRGQGKTQLQTYYLHTSLADSRTSYVAMTRHKQTMTLFVGRETTADTKHLAQQMSRTNDRGSSLQYVTLEELQQSKMPNRKTKQSTQQKLDSDAKEFNKAFEKAKSKMSPEERAQFEQERFKHSLRKMGENELNKQFAKVKPATVRPSKEVQKLMDQQKTRSLGSKTKGLTK